MHQPSNFKSMDKQLTFIGIYHRSGQNGTSEGPDDNFAIADKPVAENIADMQFTATRFECSDGQYDCQLRLDRNCLSLRS